ncbi:MAG: Rpn family recombination-promoting nuclease/putative transposase, partial [Bacteroidetes bacterium]
ELPKFNKTESELKTLVEKWIFFIKNAENLTVLPPNLDDEGLKSAYTEADRHLWTKAELDAYAYARMRETDERAREMLVEERGRNQGINQGKMEIAKKLIKRNLTNEEIAEDTGLAIEQIEKMRSETK